MTDIMFQLIKEHKYTDLIELINNDEKLDLNEKDDNNNCLIHYAILFRNIDIITLLISKKCKLDILDSDDRSIFYIPIKFNYTDIIDILLQYSNNVIGLPLLELQDKYLYIPLHYAILFNNFYAIESIINKSTNLNFKTSLEENALHLIIKSKINNKINIIKSLISKKININSCNLENQNPLHLAIDDNDIDVSKLLLDNDIDINIETTNMHYTPILIASINNNIDICKLLLNYKLNINCQDIYGNSILSYAIINKSKELIKLFYDKVNVNLVNVNGYVSLNLFFDNDYDLSKINNYYFREILIKTNINIQNLQGKTTWHYLIKYDIWDLYEDILIEKKNNIYIQDENNITPIQMIKENYSNKYDKFINLIIYSFYNIIINNNIYKINTICNKISKDKCIQYIKNLIINKHISYPTKTKLFYINNIPVKNIKKNIVMYTGITLDIISGLIYIKSKFNNIETSLTKNFINNQMLDNYYNSLGIVKLNDFLNFEIVWSYLKLFIPTNFREILDSFIKSDKKYLVIPIGLELSNGNHANILFYDKEKYELERFEPYGNNFPPGYNYNPKNLDLQINNLFSSLINNDKFKYYTPADYEIKIGLQFIDATEYQLYKNINITDPGGFCAAWCLWYVDMKLNNLSISRESLIPKLINQIRSNKSSFRTTIRNYTKNITDIRDKILSKSKLDINLWLYDNYTNKEWKDVCNNIIQFI
jgi:ankyrin repeat protein